MVETCRVIWGLICAEIRESKRNRAEQLVLLGRSCGSCFNQFGLGLLLRLLNGSDWDLGEMESNRALDAILYSRSIDSSPIMLLDLWRGWLS